MFSGVQKMWGSDVFTFPENVGTTSLNTQLLYLSPCCSKGSRVMFSRVQKMWGCDVFTSPENVGV